MSELLTPALFKGQRYPKRIVVIEGASALAFARAPQEFTSVKTAEDADRALGDEGNTQHCPLCNEFYGTRAFVTHAAPCIKLNAPRWEGERDREPPYARQKRFRLVFGSNHGRKR